MPRITDPSFPLAISATLTDKVLGVFGGAAKNITLTVLKSLVATTVEDSLTSDSATNAVSVHQAKLLNDALANKLDTTAYVQHYRGKYASVLALETAIATGADGDYAIVDTGTGNDAVYYIWDTQEGWVSGGTTTANTTDTVTEGSTNLYFTNARVRNTLLTGLSLATNAAISAADSVLSALGKLQRQITDILTNQRYTFNEQSTTTCTIASVDITSNGRVIIICANASAISGSLNTPSSYGATVGDSFNIRQGGLGAITLTATGGAVLTGAATTTAQHETKTLIAQAADTWLVVGG